MNMKTVFFIFIGMLFLHSNNNADYQYVLSQANNLFDSSRLDEALLYYKKAIKMNKKAADAYLQIGHIHLEKDLLDVALTYFKKAEKHDNYFIVPETKLDLYMNLAATYNRMRFREKQISYLQKIITVSTNHLEGYYKSYAGKAFFLLGLLHSRNKNKVESNRYFFKAVDYQYWEKSAFLYITHYYAVTDQNTIDENNREFFGKETLKTEKRSIFFNYYHEKYIKSSAGEEESAFLSEEHVAKLYPDIESYLKSLKNK